MDPRELFDAAAQERVRAAADAAEVGTSGEIVPYVVGRCDDYVESGWTGAAMGALLAAGIAAGVHGWWMPWSPAGAAWIALPPSAGAAVGWLLGTFVPPITRRLVPAATLWRRVMRRAKAAFLEEEVFKTRDRTGILIFLALFEHRAVVLADEGINRHVAQSEWQAIVDELVRGVKADRAPEALREAVRACGRLLEERRVTARPDDDDELEDHLRVRDR